MPNRFHIVVADDSMRATVSIESGEPCSTSELVEAIADAGVSRGVLTSTVEQLGQQLGDSCFAVRDKVIAEGKPVRQGKSGELHFEDASSARDIPVSHMAGGSSSDRERSKGTGSKSFVVSVADGQELGHIDPCDPGEPGFSVDGESIECEEVDNPLNRLGAGLICNSDNRVCASRTGVIQDREGEKLTVVPLPANRRIIISVSSDKMSACARLWPGEAGDSDVVSSALAVAEIRFGLIEAASKDLEQKLRDETIRTEELLVAEGKAPQHGQDGYFKPDFSVDTIAGTIRSDGSIDFRDRGALHAVSRLEVLGYYQGPTKGTPGHDVHGQETSPNPGKEVPPKLGDGVEMGKNNSVVATEDGVINYEPGGILRVIDAYEHRGNVDLKSGDLEMAGTIVVTGDVGVGASVRATEGVVIKGLVDAGSVECDGPVTVEGGVMVEGGAWIRAGGNVSCGHVQGARIECQESITISRDAVNSFLNARAIAGASAKTKILGGVLCAEEQIVVGEAGSEFGAKTVLSVAMPLDWEHETVADKLNTNAPDTSGDSKKKRARAKKLGKTEKSAPTVEQLMKTAHIDVHGTVHPGVVVEIGSLSIVVEDELQQVRFRCSSVDQEPEIVTSRIRMDQN